MARRPFTPSDHADLEFVLSVLADEVLYQLLPVGVFIALPLNKVFVAFVVGESELAVVQRRDSYDLLGLCFYVVPLLSVGSEGEAGGEVRAEPAK